MQEKPARPMRSDALANRSRFMDTAARLYVDVGYDGCTIRLIAKEAGTSLARFNRHWADKVQLFEDVFARYFTPIHQAQADALDAVVAAEMRDKSLLFAAVIRAFFEPALAGISGKDRRELGHLVYSRALIDPAPEVQRIVKDLATGSARRVSDLLRQAMPAIDAQRFLLVLSLVFGSYLHVQLFSQKIAESVGIDVGPDWKQASALIADLLLRGVPVDDGNGERGPLSLR